MSEIVGKLEHPVDGSKINNVETVVQGWTLSTDGKELELSIFVDDKLEEKIGTGIARLDINKKMPNLENAFDSGFIKRFNFSKFENGNHVMSVFAQTDDSKKLIGTSHFSLEKNNTVPFDAVVVHNNFKKSGELFVKDNLIKLGGMEPHHKVLDVGCSIGKVPMHLLNYFNEKGSYDGIDVVRFGIDWCSKHITPKYPNFQFTLADVNNKTYNPRKQSKASEYKFPFKDENFDLVFLSSVFTHLLPKDMENYFSEISRVLKKGGKALISYCLLNEESLKLIESDKSYFAFIHKFGVFRALNKNNPEKGIAYDEDFVKNLYKKNGLQIKEPIHYGGWCGRKNFNNKTQDRIIAIK